jgi:hypothetical protein
VPNGSNLGGFVSAIAGYVSHRPVPRRGTNWQLGDRGVRAEETESWVLKNTGPDG